MEIDSPIPQIDYDGYTITPLQIPKRNSNNISPNNQVIQEPYPSKKSFSKHAKPISSIPTTSHSPSSMKTDSCPGSTGTGFRCICNWLYYRPQFDILVKPVGEIARKKLSINMLLCRGILYRGLALLDEPDISVVQAIALLSIIDTLAGRKRASWVKVGMAIRISQDLDLMRDAGLNIPEDAIYSGLCTC